MTRRFAVLAALLIFVAALSTAASASTTPFASAIYGYDYAAHNARAARASISRLPAGMAAPRTTDGVWPSGHARFAGFLAAEDAGALLRGWRVGDPVNALTRAGNEPAWSTVRARYWKNAAAAAEPGEYSAANVARMRRGLAPQENGVSMELHHINPRRLGGGNEFENLEPSWPDEHAAVDPFRHVGGGG